MKSSIEPQRWGLVASCNELTSLMSISKCLTGLRYENQKKMPT